MIDFETTASPDAQAIILICSSLGAGRTGAAAVKPFGPRTWAKLQAALDGASLAGASSLVGLSAAEVDRLLGLGPADSERLVQLLARGGQLAFELDRLRSRGLWVVTLADEAYPERLRDRLTVDAPPVLFGAGERSMLTAAVWRSWVHAMPMLRRRTSHGDSRRVSLRAGVSSSPVGHAASTCGRCRRRSRPAAPSSACCRRASSDGSANRRTGPALPAAVRPSCRPIAPTLRSVPGRRWPATS